MKPGNVHWNQGVVLVLHIHAFLAEENNLRLNKLRLKTLHYGSPIEKMVND